MRYIPYLLYSEVLFLGRRCAYVKKTDICHDEQKYIPYLPLYACAGTWGRTWLFIAYILWLFILFYCLSEVAEAFLVPAVEVCLPSADPPCFLFVACPHLLTAL